MAGACGSAQALLAPEPWLLLPEVSSLAGVGAGRAHAAHRGHCGGPQGDADEPTLLKQGSVVVGIGALQGRERARALLRSCHGSPGKVRISLSAPVPDMQPEPSPWAALLSPTCVLLVASSLCPFLLRQASCHASRTSSFSTQNRTSTARPCGERCHERQPLTASSPACPQCQQQAPPRPLDWDAPKTPNTNES